VIFNFRGTGESGGNLDMLDWTRDLQAIIDYLSVLSELDKARLALVGFSGGAAVAVYTAAYDKRVSLVIPCACPAEFTLLTRSESPQEIVAHFKNIGAIRDRDFPPSVEKWLGNFQSIQPIDYIHRIAPRPLLLVHGSDDETVPVAHARLLYERAGEPKQLVIIEGAGHRLRREEKAVAAILRYLKQNLQDE
ncbi:alpha/beta hydrolase, partial [Chloroflexota bacterium]